MSSSPISRSFFSAGQEVSEATVNFDAASRPLLSRGGGGSSGGGVGAKSASQHPNLQPSIAKRSGGCQMAYIELRVTKRRGPPITLLIWSRQGAAAAAKSLAVVTCV